MEEQIREYQVPNSVRDGELHLLVADLYEEDLERYRRREAAWISGVVHAVIILLLIMAPKWTGRSTVMVLPIQPKQDTTFLALPPDELKVQAPKTNRISDKNRIAQTRTPVPSKEELRKLLDARNPGPPAKAPAPPAVPAQEPAPQVSQQAQPALQGNTPAQSQQQNTQTAKLEAPVPSRPKSPFSISSPGSSVSQAIHSVANAGHGVTRMPFGGDYGSGIRPRVSNRGDLEILSDTMGVDFGPYLARLRQTVEDHWFPLIPQSAQPPEMKKGTVIIEFAILRDGRVAGLRVITPSGDVALDRAAYGAISYAIPLPQLPQQFSGDYLLLRAHFLYNPDKKDLE